MAANCLFSQNKLSIMMTLVNKEIANPNDLRDEMPVKVPKTYPIKKAALPKINQQAKAISCLECRPLSMIKNDDTFSVKEYISVQTDEYDELFNCISDDSI
jgi:hypothetical protein